MQMKIKITSILILIIFGIFVFQSCNENDDTENSLPVVTTNAVSEVSNNTAVCGGEITFDGGSPIIEKGVCWSLTSNPTIADSVTSNGSGTGAFTSNIIGLSDSTTYYVRAYATNSQGTAYGAEIVFTTLDTHVTPYEIVTGTTTDQEGNEYTTLTIGSQIWMASNLRTTSFNDDVAILEVTSTSEWSALSSSAQRLHANLVEPDSIEYYGRMYNWYAVNTGKLCPTGWHVPSASEWDEFVNFLVEHGYNYDNSTTENKIGKAIASQIDWEVYGSESVGTVGNNTSENNSTGFAGFPGGYTDANGMTYSFHYSSYWWTSTEFNTTGATSRYLSTGSESLGMYEQTDKRNGFYVRCVKNN